MRELHKHWVSILIRGIASLLFGLIAIFIPDYGLQIIVLFFGAYAFIDGITALAVGFPSKSMLFILEGIVGILAGLFVFFYTGTAIAIFIVVVALWAIITGIVEIIASIELRKYIVNETWLMLSGVVSILFGLFVLINPVISAIAVTIIIGIYAFLFGLMLLALSQQAKDYKPRKASKKR